MARLTIASLTAELATYNISLTGKTGAYTTVVPSGFSCSHKTLTEVKEYTDEYMSINSFVEPQTEPTVEEAINTQSTRTNQLATYAQARGIELDWLEPSNSLTQDEDEIAAELVRQCEQRRATKEAENRELMNYKARPNNEHNSLWALGFAGFGKRVSTRLQKRANKFHAMLSVA